MSEPFSCPRCRKQDVRLVATIFVEHGEITGTSYPEDGFTEAYRCADPLCGYTFGDLTAFALVPPESEDDPHLLPPHP